MKSHFQFSNQQRNGIFLLMAILITAQSLYWWLPNLFPYTNEHMSDNKDKLEAFKEELDSLRLVQQQNNAPKIYPFNPNYITDHKGYALGMTNEEIDRLHQFRENNQWVNSAKQFQQVTKVSDSLLGKISPYFKFPEWVTNRRTDSRNFTYAAKGAAKPKTYDQKIDLNKATTNQLKKVYGVGDKLASRITTYRDKFAGGFISDIQLSEVYGLSPEVIARIKNDFTVKTPRAIKTLNLNTATRDELVTIQYIDYEIAHNIIEERTLRDGYTSLEELMKVEDFPIKKFDIIKLYLHL